MNTALPLQGITVLDISTYIAGPAAAVVLGDYGADVIKVEQPRRATPVGSTRSSSPLRRREAAQRCCSPIARSAASALTRTGKA